METSIWTIRSTSKGYERLGNFTIWTRSELGNHTFANPLSHLSAPLPLDVDLMVQIEVFPNLTKMSMVFFLRKWPNNNMLSNTNSTYVSATWVPQSWPHTTVCDTAVRWITSGTRVLARRARTLRAMFSCKKFSNSTHHIESSNIYIWSIKCSWKNNSLHNLTVNDETNLLNLISL